MEKNTAHFLNNHTDPFGTHHSAALCLRATAASGEGALLNWAAGNGPPLSVLLLELLLLVALPTATASLLSLCAHTPNLSSSLFRKTCESGTLAFYWIRPLCSTISLVPGLLIALCRAIGSSTSVSSGALSLRLPTLTQT